MYLDSETSVEHDFVWMVKNTVVPRPVAWVTTRSAAGVDNLAPYSYFNLVSMNPPALMMSFTGEKDTYDNIVETGQFVVNLITDGLAEVATASAAITDPAHDEAANLGLELLPSSRIDTPRLAIARVALECELVQRTSVLGANVIFGRVLGVHVDDEILDESGRPSTELYRPVGRMGGSLYTTVNHDYRFVVPVATPEWLAAQPGGEILPAPIHIPA
jgi:flavin reductase (DIM6/NTAB) family NADH-FMN oxidoreductase RutF